MSGSQVLKKHGAREGVVIALAFIFLLALVLSSVAVADAATYYVSPGGSDSSSGIISAPFRTIQKAANIVNPGDTVYVRAGTYNARVSLRRSGTPGNYITFQNYPGETAILDGIGLGNGIMFNGINVSWLKIIGFKIRNHTGAGILIQSSGTYIGSHIEIRDNEIFNQLFESGHGHAILVAAWPWGSMNAFSDVIIDGNYIHDVVTGAETGADEALTVAGIISKFQITNNILDNTDRIGIDLIGKNSQYPHDGIVANNEVRNCGIQDAHSNIYVDGAKNVVIENNIVHDNRGIGIAVSVEQAGFVTENVIVRRNVVWNNFRGIAIGGSYLGVANHLRVVHNDAIINQQGNYPIYKGDYNIVKNNISYIAGDTLFHLEHYYGITHSPSFDYNCYYPNAGKQWHYKGSFYTPLSGFQAIGQDTHGIAQDPRFTNISANDFTLRSDSPAIDRGGFLTRTVSSGSGTVIPVSDAKYFHDGYGISGVSGDTIRVGSNTVIVTDVNYSTNTITVDRSISWNSGDGVSYSYSGSGPDIGAYEHAVKNRSNGSLNTGFVPW